MNEKLKMADDREINIILYKRFLVSRNAVWIILIYIVHYLLGFIYYLIYHNSVFFLLSPLLLAIVSIVIWKNKDLIKNVYYLLTFSVIVFIVNYLYVESDYYKNLVTALFLILTGIYQLFLKEDVDSVLFVYWMCFCKLFQILLGFTIIANSYEKELDLFLSFGTIFFTGGLLFFLTLFSFYIFTLKNNEAPVIIQPKVLEEKDSPLTIEENDTLSKLTTFFEDTDIYTHVNFSFDDLSDNLKIPKSELSQLIHKVYGINFYKFIAFKRISYAIKKLEEHNGQTTIENVMVESGFSSKPTFYKYFKEVTGGTPSEFIDKN